MPKVTQLVMNLQSKPGVLANVAGVLSKAGVNIEGICASETAGRGKIRLLVSDAGKAEAALKAAKLRCGREDAISVTLENRPGYTILASMLTVLLTPVVIVLLVFTVVGAGSLVPFVPMRYEVT